MKLDRHNHVSISLEFNSLSVTKLCKETREGMIQRKRVCVYGGVYLCLAYLSFPYYRCCLVPISSMGGCPTLETILLMARQKTSSPPLKKEAGSRGDGAHLLSQHLQS